MLLNHRLQHAVGQGFFHSGDLFEDGQLRHRYVYDCGAMQKYRVAREHRIKSYLRRTGARSPLHTLFLSHVHADHLNGVEQLLDGKSGLAVDTIMLPLVNVADRLIAYARTVVEDGASAQSEFYRTFTIDPTAALSRFEPRQILFVEPGNRDDGAPGGDDRPIGGPEGGGVLFGPEGEGGPAWLLVGTGRVRWHDPRVQPILPAKATQAVVIPDTMALMTPAAQQEWILVPFVDPTVAAHRKAFLNALAAARKLSRRKLDAWLAVTANIQQLVTNDLSDLAGAYAAVARDLNLTSMCLYSGPRATPAVPVLHHVHFGRSSRCRHGGRQRVAWLATGDAALKEKQRRADFIEHYRGLFPQVVTLTLPHHGSDRNFHPELLSAANPAICVASADAFSTWKHPGPHTVQGVCGQGRLLHVVTSDPRSTVREWVEV
jgi:hypothetical protein